MRIVFVCYANMCRSPMAEGLARKELQGLADVESAGTHAWSGSASSEAVAVMRSKFGVDISSHRSRNVRDVKLDDFDRIVAMDSDVCETLSGTYPSVRSKLISWEIVDPVGKGVEVYERSAKQILEHIRELHSCLRSESSSTSADMDCSNES